MPKDAAKKTAAGDAAGVATKAKQIQDTYVKQALQSNVSALKVCSENCGSQRPSHTLPTPSRGILGAGTDRHHG